MKCFLFFVIFLILLVLCQKEDTPRDIYCTVIVYMVVDNDLSEDAYQQLDWCKDSGFYQLFRSEERETKVEPTSGNLSSKPNGKDMTRQGETPEVQPHGGALPP